MQSPDICVISKSPFLCYFFPPKHLRSKKVTERKVQNLSFKSTSSDTNKISLVQIYESIQRPSTLRFLCSITLVTDPNDEAVGDTAMSAEKARNKEDNLQRSQLLTMKRTEERKTEKSVKATISDISC